MAIEDERDRGNKMKILRVPVAIVLPLILAGCTAPYEGKYDFAQGWRQGTVLSLDVGATPGPSRVDCRKVLPPGELATTRFVYVSYFMSGGHARKVIAAAHQDTVLQIGDTVYLRVKDCSQRLIPAAARSAE
jgi:hypothetical protein